MKGQSGEISIRNVRICFPAAHRVVEAVKDISVDLSPGTFTTLPGPSGCGKSSLLGAIAGFVPLTQGQILIDSRPVDRPDGSRGVVFQHHNLFPWKTVRGNVEFGLKMRRVRKEERRRLSDEILERVKLRGFQHSYPDQLSGGMLQRVNLARVLVNRPAVMMLDEPFAALDAQTRLQMQEMLLELWHDLKMTIVFVTHDVDEAILLSDRVLVMSRRPGRLRADFEVPLPRPRSAEQLTSADFNRLKNIVWSCFGKKRIWKSRHRTAMRSRFRVWSLPLRRPSRAGSYGRAPSYLSRRDLMIVARQFIAWYPFKKGSVP